MNCRCFNTNTKIVTFPFPGVKIKIQNSKNTEYGGGVKVKNTRYRGFEVKIQDIGV